MFSNRLRRTLFQNKLIKLQNRFAHHTNSFSVKAYPAGPVLTSSYEQSKQVEIAASKRELKKFLVCQDPDLSSFVDLLFDYKGSARILLKIDAQAEKTIDELDPGLFGEFQQVLQEGRADQLNVFFTDRFLPSLRKIFSRLAQHYGFEPDLVETNDGLLLDDDFIEFVEQGKLYLDLGEDAHGPLPHLIAAFMMKEFEAEGRIASARSLYQSLTERCEYYCPERTNYVHRFLLLLDYPNCYPITETVFCNPASLSNHLLFYGKSLGQLAVICKNHARELREISRAEWREKENKCWMTKGKVLL